MIPAWLEPKNHTLMLNDQPRISLRNMYNYQNYMYMYYNVMYYIIIRELDKGEIRRL